VSVVFRLENVGSADFAALTDLGTHFGQVSLFFVFWEKAALFLQREEKGVRNEKSNGKPRTYIVIATLVGAEHHSATRQAFSHSSLVSLLLRKLDLFEAVLTINGAIQAVGLVFGQILAKHRGGAILAIDDLKLALLKPENE
jgi:hypothetical protein